MTSTDTRRPAVPRKVATAPARPRTASRARSADLPSVWWPGAVAAGWALGAGLVAITLPVLLIWAADGRSGADSVEATRMAAQLWLLAHGTALQAGDGAISLTPLGLTLLPLGLLHRAGRHSVRQLTVRQVGHAWALVTAIVLPYALVATCLTAVVGTDRFTPEPVRALLGSFAVALLGASTGVLREAGLLGLGGLRDSARRVLAAGASAAGMLLLLGVLTFAATLITHAGRVSSLSQATGPGIVGGAGLLVLQVLLVPNAAVWGASWLAGPGFAIGVGTHVSPWATTLGQVPAVPMLGGLPTEPPSTGVTVLTVLVTLAAGGLGGWLLADRQPRCMWQRTASEGLFVGVAAGALLGVLAFVSGGPLGGGRLVAVGPSAWQVALAVAVQVGAAAAATASLRRWRSSVT